MYNFEDLDLAISNAYSTIGHLIVVLNNSDVEEKEWDGRLGEAAMTGLREAEDLLESLAESYGVSGIG